MVTLEDLEGSVQLLVMNDYDKFRPLLERTRRFSSSAKSAPARTSRRFSAGNHAARGCGKEIHKQVHLRLNIAHFQPRNWNSCANSPRASRQVSAVSLFHPAGRRNRFCRRARTFGVTLSLELEQAVNKEFGEKTYYARVDTSLPEKQRRSWEKKKRNARVVGRNKKLAFAGGLRQIFCRINQINST